MEKDLNDIELIDKYLSAELSQAEQELFNQRFLTDEGFKQEVAVYQKIYEGIKQAQRDHLKKSLDVFYDEYAEEREEAEPPAPVANNVRSINWRRTLYIISGVAAAVLIFTTVLLFKRDAANNTNTTGTDVHARVDPPPATPGIPGDTAIKDKQPQIAEHKKVPGNKQPQQRVDSGRNQIVARPKNAYAFTNQEPLPAESIRQGTYPEPLTYTFTDGQIIIYGDPLLAMLYLDLYKHDGHYYAAIDGTTYEMEQNVVSRRFVKRKIKVSGAARSGESIAVIISPIKTTVYSNTPFGVVVVKDDTSNQYFFTKGEDGNKLVLQGDFSVTNTKVIYVKKDGAVNWYVVRGTDVYGITQFGSKPTPLKPLAGEYPSDEARMFFGRDAFQKTVSTF